MPRHALAPMVIFSNTDQFIAFPATPWMDATDWEQIRESLETRNMPAANAMTVTVGIQTAQTPNDPDQSVALSISRTADGMTFPGSPVNKSTTTGSKQLVRGVYLAKNTAGGDTTVRHCWAAAVIEARKA